MTYYLRPHLGALLGPIFPNRISCCWWPLGGGFSKVHLKRRTVSQDFRFFCIKKLCLNPIRKCFDAFENLFVLRRYSKKRVSEVESVKQIKVSKISWHCPFNGSVAGDCVKQRHEIFCLTFKCHKLSCGLQLLRVRISKFFLKLQTKWTLGTTPIIDLFAAINCKWLSSMNVCKLPVTFSLTVYCYKSCKKCSRSTCHSV